VNESAGLPGAAVTALSPVLEAPLLYLACPLTGLGDKADAMEVRVERIKECIREFTDESRVPLDKWQVSSYAPIDYTAPWMGDQRSPREIYEINLQALSDSDGLIVITHRGSSAGVGQEIEWARGWGIPILYLSADEASRQIRGIPHPIIFSRYEDDDEACARVHAWLAANRAVIEDGPRRRTNRNLAYFPLTAALSQAWHKTVNKTDTALRAGLQPAGVECLLESSARLSAAPFATVVALATELGVPIGRRSDLRLLQARAWVDAATQCGWDDETADRVRFYALLRASDGLDLESVAGWIRVHTLMTAALS
jgi:hypothetical protein